MLSHDSPEVLAFLTRWHETGRASFERRASSLVYDSYEPKTAKTRRRFVACDRGSSGCFLVERTTGTVYSIKGYGVPKSPVGHVSSMFADGPENVRGARA